MKQWRIAVMAIAFLFIVFFAGHFGISSPKPDTAPSKEREIDIKQKQFDRESVRLQKKKPKLFLFRKKRNSTVSSKGANKSSHITLKSLCWVKEQFIALDECKRCHPFEKRTLTECQRTGNIQHVKCKSSGGEGYKSCPHVRWFEKRKFWIFEAGILIILICSGFMVWHRARELEAKFYEKLSKQVSDNV